MLDAWLYGDRHKNLPGIHRYWESIYNEKDDSIERYDVKMTFFQSFTRQVAKNMTSSSKCLISQIWKAKESNYYMHRDKLQGVLVKFDVKIVRDERRKELAEFETWFQRVNTTVLRNKNMAEPGARLKGIDVSYYQLQS